MNIMINRGATRSKRTEVSRSSRPARHDMVIWEKYMATTRMFYVIHVSIHERKQRDEDGEGYRKNQRPGGRDQKN